MQVIIADLHPPQGLFFQGRGGGGGEVSPLVGFPGTF